MSAGVLNISSGLRILRGNHGGNSTKCRYRTLYSVRRQKTRILHTDYDFHFQNLPRGRQNSSDKCIIFFPSF